MEASANPNAAEKLPPVFPKTIHEPRPNAVASAKHSKRGAASSQSRDLREDRGTREIKTSHHSQTMPHGGNQQP